MVHAHVARPKVVDFATAARGTIDFAAMPAMVFALGVGKENAFGFGQGGGIGRDGKTLGQHHAAIGLMVRDPFHVNDWLNLSKLLGYRKNIFIFVRSVLGGHISGKSRRLR